MGIAAYFRLARAGYILAREGALSIFDPAIMPPPMRLGIRIGRLIERPEVRRTGRVERLTRALKRLGPTYVKFGQTLATRPDIVGNEVAADLAVLQDAMDPFDAALVPGLLEGALGPRAAELKALSEPIAAASIAQVHRAVLEDGAGGKRRVAVKILRPGVKARFLADIESYYSGARLAEGLAPSMRRLRPTDVVETLERSALLELDLRLEAAAISEFAENIKDDEGFVIPEVSWDHTAETVLTTSWVDGIPIRDFAALEAAGLNRKDLARKLLQAFLRHAIRDGFFHADMHPGNLFADPRTGNVVAVDFGIMGRISRRERRFLADILYGFISRDYRMIALRHFEIGYVPRTQSVDDFALALRAIGEPLQGRTARDISMANVLGQLFTTTELFEMQTRPELVMLQKAMVLVEGVARSLDPELDIFTIAEPVVGDWVRREAGPLGRIEDARDGFTVAAETIGRLPALVARAETVLGQIETEHAARQVIVGPVLLRLGFWIVVLTCVTLVWSSLT
ncbi:2-polyprenylphenol 6-hydroxylase [Arsenicitalea aurantiaca]|uniref:2-polyprenylphenol 6-hydroxylase n=1 Tax=Arsenicitalea aurantiaca TaxID=1783274 RepID=A0A433X876_9HYPH|nr:2-polyprenylphenol 6-hydroxylase [Arsenicitalea aurantiaca]RUT30248.1 2-polyprenylphenol 6-hydroxylase [Arsenicitalea aurantiaca]